VKRIAQKEQETNLAVAQSQELRRKFEKATASCASERYSSYLSKIFERKIKQNVCLPDGCVC